MKTKSVKEKPLLFHVGNLIIVVSLLVFFVAAYPLISIYLFPPEIKNQSSLEGNYITVAKINAQAPIIFNVDPFNDREYKKVLKKGVAHAKGTALPGEKGSVFIFAHSSGNPLEIASYNTIFFRLGELEKNDLIEIRREQKTLRYKVVDKKTVWPNEVKYLTDGKSNQLILQTCWPIGTTIKRLLIFAKPVV